MSILRYLAPATLLGLVVFSCTTNSLPPLEVASGLPSDSLAYVTFLGDSTLSVCDTLVFGDEESVLYPDTSLYNRAYLVYPQRDSVVYYAYKAGLWQTAEPERRPDSLARQLPYYYMRDTSGKYHSHTVLSAGRTIAYSFASPAGLVLHRDSLRSLRMRYGGDSLLVVYLYLTPSDSTARRLVKRDTLRGTVFSDSLGEVSRLREQLGIARSAEPHTFVVDSAQRIIRRL